MRGTSVRHHAGLALGHVLAWLSRHMLRRGGNVIGGAVLLRLSADGVAAAARRHRITVVSGTNGKSTTTAMIVAALGTRGSVATNTDGANTAPGLAWCVATARAEDVVLEVDEAWLPWAIETLSPDQAVLLNLTRDQLHRNPEILALAGRWRSALRTVPRAVAVADNPAVTWAAAGAQHSDFVGVGAGSSPDSVLCPSCGAVLDRGERSWSCACGLSMPAATVWVSGRRVVVDGADIGAYDALPGPVNAANAAAAIAATRDRVPPNEALAAIARVHEVEGRYHDVLLEGRRVRLLLAKNPAGWHAALGMLRAGASVLLVFSADGVDGRDTSWLYDVSFDELRGRSVAVAGPRRTDMALRLHLDGIEPGVTHASTRAALRSLPAGDVDVLATYSAFQRVRRELGVA